MAPAILAPCGSVTSPVTVPRLVCAAAASGLKTIDKTETIATRKVIHFTLFILSSYLFGPTRRCYWDRRGQLHGHGPVMGPVASVTESATAIRYARCPRPQQMMFHLP